MSLRVFYDGDCPLCSSFVRMTRLREATGPVDLVDLRNDAEARGLWTAEGLDPDRGIIIETGGRAVFGADAVTALAAMSSPAGVLNRLAAGILARPRATALLYPLMRAGRNLTMTLLDRPPLRAEDAGESALCEIFARLLGLMTVLHVFIYYFRYTPMTSQATSLPLLMLGLWLIFSPGSKRVFVGVVIAMSLDGWLNAPIYSNHTILKNFLMLAFIAAGLWHWLRGSAWEVFFRDVRPVARTLLLVMYTFGILHKINSDFLDPAVSCAVALWQRMPPPLVWIDAAPMHYLAIWGTFATEGLIMVFLIVPRWRHFGIVLGIGFHSMLALSGYAMYPVFSTLSIALHTLFISPAAALNITGSAMYRQMDERINSPAGVAFLIAAFTTIAFFALLRDYNMVALVWLVLVIWPLAIIVRHGRSDTPGEGGLRFFLSGLAALNAVSLLFVLNCAAPFLGLKTAQAMNMFANLRLEGGVSNHLVFRAPPGPFGYLADLVTVSAAEGSPYLERAAGNEDQALVFYHFLSVLDAAPDARVSYTRDGVLHSDQLARDILAAEGEMLHTAWMRKFFHFRPVRLSQPTPCD
jgi:predicted DCC family thiol-disulfide oxidoreductase YuxK